jgi:hypothetical protein
LNQHYFSPTGGFSADESHGARTLSVPIPTWMPPSRPTVRRADPDWVPSGKAGELQPFIDVPDPEWTPPDAPRIEVPNPDTRVPANAKPISAELHAYLLEGQAQGKLIDVDAAGFPVLRDRPPPSDEEVAAIGLKRRDEALAVAASRIAPLQDAVDLMEATALEEDLLRAWKAHRIALMRITSLHGWPHIVWPQEPY